MRTAHTKMQRRLNKEKTSWSVWIAQRHTYSRLTYALGGNSAALP